MKETLTRLFLLLSLCLLISCDSNHTDPQTSIPEQDQTPTINEIIQRSEAQIKDADTFTLQLNMTQTISEGNFSEETVKSNTRTYYNVSPLAYHQTVDTETNTSKSSDSIQTRGEQYVTEDGAFMLSHSSDEWMEVPLELTQDVIAFQNVQLEPIRYLEIIKEHAEDIQLIEEDTHYKLEIDGEGPKLRDLVMQLYHISNLANEQQSFEIVNQMNIELIDYDIYINKETYLLDRVSSEIDLLTNYEGEQVQINLNLETEMMDYNSTDTIEIPEEIIHNAKEYKINIINSDETNS
ncbi:DUF6612 family protein [Alkalicoccobacillus porphyridii]|uniref:LppX_LprAFG lipoprotein n=1 Tax=Alkalicoccobacillus porphyridii TaxID=2597270 RepID=A0A554A030_9BACI|nr:DUF6612 family protein [Alkalicoccobacillus porphyridii]TSB47035.1 hypothetical protein FN960_08430 [Alkalicoccobacillus porphyridii]